MFKKEISAIIGTATKRICKWSRLMYATKQPKIIPMIMTNGGNTLRFSVVFLLKWKKRKLEMPRTAQTTMNGTKTSCRSETLAWARNGVANVMVLYHLTIVLRQGGSRAFDCQQRR